jgi:hypothetical protein
MPVSLADQLMPRSLEFAFHTLVEKRLAIVEPVFANIRSNKRLDRFTLRGKITVNIQWLMFCLVHNREKFLNYGMAPA